MSIQRLTKALFLLLTFFLFLSPMGIPSFLSCSYSQIKRNISQPSIYTIENITVVSVTGDSYQMGYQQGSLLSTELYQNLRAFSAYTSTRVSNESLLRMWEYMEPFVPTEYKREMQGLADGSNITFTDIAKAYMTIVWLDLGCISVACWNNATVDQEMLHARSLDFPLTIKDPVTNNYVHEHQFLLLRNPKNRQKTLTPTVAGTPNFGGGFSEAKIAIGNQVCQSKDNSFNGTPIQFRIQQALEYAPNITKAISFLTRNKTIGWNQVVADASTNTAVAIETTANQSAVHYWNDLDESKSPFTEIPFVVRRTNFFINQSTSATQRSHYNPSGFLGFIRMMLSDEYFFTPWILYKALSDQILSDYGSMDVSTVMHSIRLMYHGNTDPLLNLLSVILHGVYHFTGFLNPWHQWVCNLNTGELAISFASADKPAHENQIHTINIYELFKSI